MNPSEPASPRPAWIRILIVVLAAAVLLSVVGSLLIAFRLFPRPSVAEVSAQDARDACRKASRKLLRNPDGTQWLDAEQWRASGDASGKWTVVLHYRLTDRQGVSISRTADCTVQHDPAINEWRLLDLVEN